MTTRHSHRLAALAAACLVLATGLVPQGLAHESEPLTAFNATCGHNDRCHAWYEVRTEEHWRAYPLDNFVSADGATVYAVGRAQFIHTDGAEYYFAGAWDAVTGAEKWFTRVRDGSWSDPAHATLSPNGARIYMTGTINRGDTYTVAFDTATGAVAWQVRDDAFVSSTGGVGVHPSPVGTTVYVLSEDGGSCCRTGSIMVSAYDAATGTRLWSSLVERRNGAIDAHAMSPDGTKLFYADEGGPWRVRAVDLVARAALWATDVGFGHTLNNDPADMVADNARVYVVGSSKTKGRDSGTDATREWHMTTVALDAATGAEAWRHVEKPTQEFLLGHVGTASRALLDQATGRLFVGGHQSFDTTLDQGLHWVAYEATSGTLLWRVSYPHQTWGQHTGGHHLKDMTMTPDGGHLYGIAESCCGLMLTVALDTQDGSTAWSGRAPRSCGGCSAGVVPSPSGDWAFVTVGLLTTYRVPNHRPIADMQPLPGVVLVGDDVFLDGSGSHDHDLDDFATCAWRVGPAGSTFREDLARACKPDYTAGMDRLSDQCFRLIATDRWGFSSAREECAYINAPPVAKARAYRASFLEGATASFLDAGSYDPNRDGSITARTWTLDGQVVGEGSRLDQVFETFGWRCPVLGVTDDKGATGASAPDAACAYINALPVPVPALRPMVLDGSASYDPDPANDRIVRHAWYVPGHGTVAGAERSLAFPDGRDRCARLSVTDAWGADEDTEICLPEALARAHGARVTRNGAKVALPGVALERVGAEQHKAAVVDLNPDLPVRLEGFDARGSVAWEGDELVSASEVTIARVILMQGDVVLEGLAWGAEARWNLHTGGTSWDVHPRVARVFVQGVEVPLPEVLEPLAFSVGEGARVVLFPKAVEEGPEGVTVQAAALRLDVPVDASLVGGRYRVDVAPVAAQAGSSALERPDEAAMTPVAAPLGAREGLTVEAAPLVP